MGVDRDTLFRAALKNAGLPQPIAEHRFHPTRKWRWDYCWALPIGITENGDIVIGGHPMVALEVDGGVWTRGKHGRGSGIVKDHEKRNEGAVLGWRLLVTTPSHLCTKEMMDTIRRALAA